MQFYKIGGAEYSQEIKFFLAHQIGISKSQEGYTFHSRIEKKAFRKLHETGQKELSEADELRICKEIHKEILNGKHGEGKLID